MKNSEKFTNELINETSPYLLQHAHNPVDWQAWNDATLEDAIEKGKLMIISVGYSACHWCHVMEHESFEDEAVAKIMNDHYICIKVDREERPDVDQVYMNAVQAMTGAGGWPMNVVALPDGRPVWGGTYFKKEQWKEALNQISKLYRDQPAKLHEYANRLEEGLQQMELIDLPEEHKEFDESFFGPILKRWESFMDFKNGGPNGAPKFMMPSNLNFLMRFAFQSNDKKLLDYVFHSLNKISYGGIYDPVAGGFSRYSVDERWHVPHFEKMLYDNAQLLSLYSEAYKINKSSWYKKVVYQTADFLIDEMRDPSGAFYSAYDADSPNENTKNEEGAFYVWKKEQLQEILQDHFELFSKYYHIDAKGYWENGNYVLFRSTSAKNFASENDLELETFQKLNDQWLQKLKNGRNSREKPGLDDKSLTSWNAMTISGFCKAYQAFPEKRFKSAAEDCLGWLLKNMLNEKGQLLHNYKNEKSTINGYLEDYAFSIQALVDLFETFANDEHLDVAKKLCLTVEEEFNDPASPLYFFTSSKDRNLITRTREITDNVIPASNSVLAKCFFRIGKLTEDREIVEKALKMVQAVGPKIPEYPQYYSNWLDLAANFAFPFYEIAICGNDFQNKLQELQLEYLPDAVLAGGEKISSVEILKDRFKENQTLTYVCEEGKCLQPVETKEAVLGQIRQV